MAHNALLVGGLLILLVLVLAHLQPAELLRPSLLTKVMIGVVAGVLSSVVLVVFQWSAAELGVVAYPTAIAFVGVYFGPLSSLITAAVALLALIFYDHTDWQAVITVVAGALILAAVWRRVDARHPQHPWLSIAGIAVTLPPTVLLCLQWSGDTQAPASLISWFLQLPWYHGAGMLILGTGRQLLVNKDEATLALQRAHRTLEEREQPLRLALESLGGGRWEWDVDSRSFRVFGAFYEAFGITPADAGAPDLWQRWYGLRHPVDAERNAAKLERARDGLEENYEAEFRVKDTAGQWRWLMSRASCHAAMRRAAPRG